MTDSINVYLRHWLKGSYYVFWREMRRFLHQKTRIFMIIFQPMVWLVLMGNMMTRLSDNPYTKEMLGVDNYLSFMVPGIMVMSCLFSGVYGGVSIIWDRRTGYLTRLLSAPVPRYSIATGKAWALAIQAMIQVSVIAVAAAFLGVEAAVTWPVLLSALFICSLFSGIMSGISLTLSATIRTPETLFAVMNFLTMPLIFTSSALFPTTAMPGWIYAIARVNPVSFAVGPLRQIMTDGITHISHLFLFIPGLAVLVGMLMIIQVVLFLRFEKGSLL